MKNRSYLSIEFGPGDNDGADKMVEKLSEHAVSVEKREQFGMTVDETRRKTSDIPWRILVHAMFNTRKEAEEVRKSIWKS